MTNPHASEAARKYAETAELLAAETRESLLDVRRATTPGEVDQARRAAIDAAGAAGMTALQAEDAAAHADDRHEAREQARRARTAASEARALAESARTAADQFAAR